MTRSGYGDGDGDFDPLEFGRWRGALLRAIRGRRGQAFFRELIETLEAMPDKQLIKKVLINNVTGQVCALGAVGQKRGLTEEMLGIDPHDYGAVAHLFDLPVTLVREIEWINDEVWVAASSAERHVELLRWARDKVRRTNDRSK